MKTYLIVALLGFLCTKPICSNAQDNDSIVLKGKCYFRDTLINPPRNKPLLKTTVILVSKKDRSKKITETDKNGEYRFNLSPNADYYVFATKNGYYKSVKESISTQDVKVSNELTQDLFLRLPDLIERNFLYKKRDCTDIDSSNAKILNSLRDLLIEYPDFVLQIQSHTDCRGSDKHCDSVSQLRANIVKNYLVAKGIDSSRLVAKGFGRKYLVNNCNCMAPQATDGSGCTEAEHMANNRTEFKIIRTGFDAKKE